MGDKIPARLIAPDARLVQLIEKAVLLAALGRDGGEQVRAKCVSRGMTRDISFSFTPARIVIPAVLALCSISAGAQGLDPAAPPVAPAPVVPPSPVTSATAVPVTDGAKIEDFKLTPSELVVKTLPELNSLPVEPVTSASGALAEKSKKDARSSSADRVVSARAASVEKAARENSVESGLTPAVDSNGDVVSPEAPRGFVSSGGEGGGPDVASVASVPEGRAGTGSADSADSNVNIWLGGGAALLLLGGGAAFLLARRGKEAEGEEELLLSEDRAIPDSRRISDILTAPDVPPTPANPVPSLAPVSGDAEVRRDQISSAQDLLLTRTNSHRRANFMMTHSYPAAARLDYRPPLRVRS